MPYAESPAPKSSPWGVPQDVERLAPGVWSVACAGHGGIKLSPARNRAIPAVARAAGGWYEEDCDWAIPAAVFPDAFPARMAERAALVLGRYQPPEVFTALTGEAATPENCEALRKAAFFAEHAAAYVVTSALRAPDGLIDCYALPGAVVAQGRGSVAGGVKFRVAADRYASRSGYGYVIQADDARAA